MYSICSPTVRKNSSCYHFIIQDLKEAWQRLRQLALARQENLFGAHEIQRFNRDADETVAWITEKDVVLSSNEFGRDLASVQTLQVSLFFLFSYSSSLI